MKKSNIVPVVLIGAGIAYIATQANNKKKALETLKVANPKISNIVLNLLKTTFNITLDVVNPSGVNLPFEYYYGTVAYTDIKLADFNFNMNGKNIILKARTSTPLTFQVTISNPNVVVQLVKFIKQINSGQKIDSLIHVQSVVSAAGVDVPANFSYDLKTKATISGIGKRKGGFFKKLLRVIKPPHMKIMDAIRKKVKKKIESKVRAKIQREQGAAAPAAVQPLPGQPGQPGYQYGQRRGGYRPRYRRPRFNNPAFPRFYNPQLPITPINPALNNPALPGYNAALPITPVNNPLLPGFNPSLPKTALTAPIQPMPYTNASLPVATSVPALTAQNMAIVAPAAAPYGVHTN